jgi:hypothetical protein
LTVGLVQINGFEHCANFVSFKVFDGRDSRSFGRDSEDTLAEFYTLGMAGCEKTCERMDGCESGIARRGAVSTLGLQIIEEGKQIIGAKMPDIQFDDLAVVSCGEKT